MARGIVNATGPFCDGVRRMEDNEAAASISPSQGVHIVLARDFLPGNTAIMVPHTRDGRVMFAIPWNGYVVVGTTDTPLIEVALEPRAFAYEVDFILDTAGDYLARRPQHADIKSVFAGIRPLVKAEDSSNTSALSREHTIRVSKSGLLTITGGKWTTYRRMAEDAVNHAAILAQLDERPCVTRELHVHGYHRQAERFGSLSGYGSDAVQLELLIQKRPELAEPLHQELPILEAEVCWAASHEMARTLDDVLARRTRALYLNARAACEMAPRVAQLMAKELGFSEAWQQDQLHAFGQIAAGYLLT